MAGAGFHTPFHATNAVAGLDHAQGCALRRQAQRGIAALVVRRWTWSRPAVRLVQLAQRSGSGLS